MAVDLLKGLSPSPAINISSYLRLGLIDLVMSWRQRQGQRVSKGRNVNNLKDAFNEHNRDIMIFITEAYKCDNVGELLKRVDDWVKGEVKAFEDLGYSIVFNAVIPLMTRLAIGLRHPYTGPLEPAIAWDPYWNLPYIPSSSLKGAMRSIAETSNHPCVKALGEQKE
ncbi:RAMP superfamily CRISPR-associated protein, partial [Caldivirga sp.]|uniref:RAMP superfamily CRISPR-associated protein n=1 Tax=Caldivirga sp. TaxID=2080243 RepID=UPI003D0DF170